MGFIISGIWILNFLESLLCVRTLLRIHSFNPHIHCVRKVIQFPVLEIENRGLEKFRSHILWLPMQAAWSERQHHNQCTILLPHLGIPLGKSEPHTFRFYQSSLCHINGGIWAWFDKPIALLTSHPLKHNTPQVTKTLASKSKEHFVWDAE